MNEWEAVSLASICQIVQGGRLKLSGKNFTQYGEFPAFGAGGLNGWLDKCEFEMPGIVLSSIGARCGKCFLTPIRWTSLANTQLIFPKKDRVDINFLWYQLNDESSWPRSGAAQPFIRPSDVKARSIILPPLAEQKRIAAILDEAFEGIAKATANAERNLANARELFDIYLDTSLGQMALAYPVSALEEVTHLITKGSSPNWQGIEYVETPGVLFVTSENVGSNEMLLSKRKYVENRFNDKDRKSILRRDDVLTNIVGASIGRTAVFDCDDIANINQAVCLIRCDKGKIIPSYLSLLLNSGYFRRILHDNEVNNARANLSLGFFRSLDVPVPPLSTQKEMVLAAEEIAAITDNLKRKYSTKLEQLAELRQSLLHKAFSGQLPCKETIAA